MEHIQNNKGKLDDIKKKLEEVAFIKQQIIEGLLNLPDNPKINRTVDTGRSSAYVMNIQDFVQNTKNMSATHYDFKAQYKAIASALKYVPVENILEKVMEIISTGKVTPKVTMGKTFNGLGPIDYSDRTLKSGEPIPLHPEVIKNIKTYFGLNNE